MTVMFGWGKFATAGPEISALGRRPLLVTGASSARAAGLVDTLDAQLAEGGRSLVAGEPIIGEARTDVIDRLAATARDERCDVVVGLGGGAAMDAAKAVAFVASSGMPAWETTDWGRVDGVGKMPPGRVLPVVCIPTTPGTGSEVNEIAVLLNPDHNQKAVVVDQRIRPALAIIDPSLTAGLNRDQFRASSLDALSHGIEDYLTRPEPDFQYASRVTQLATRWMHLEIGFGRPGACRLMRTGLAAFATRVWDGTYNDEQTPWTLHSIAHVVGAHLDLGHAVTISRLLPAWLEFIAERDPSRISPALHAVCGLPRPALPERCMDVQTDCLAQEVLATYGDGVNLPGWPEMGVEEVAQVIAAAVSR